MLEEDVLPIGDRLTCIFDHLGIKQVHVAARMPEDWIDFVT